MKKIRFAISVISVFMKNQVQNKAYLLHDIVNMISRCFIVFMLYGYVFSINNDNINGADYNSALWSMFIYFCVMTLSTRKIYNLIMNDVKSGNVEMFLNRPVNYVFFSFYKQLGSGLYSFFIISLLGSFLMVLFVGLPEVNLAIFIPTFIITFILGVILALIIYSIIGLLSFFMQDVRPVFWITDKIVMVLGGSYLPISLFPPIMKFIAFVSPFGAINFTSSTVYNSWNDEFLIRILIQFGWVIVFAFLLMIVYKKAREKSMINGG